MLIIFGVIFSVLSSAVLDKKAKFDECMLDESTSRSCLKSYEEYYKQVKYNQENPWSFERND
jgi:hypothetical protein